MIEIEVSGGPKAWINVLMIKSVETTTRPDEFRLAMQDGAEIMGKGDAASIASAVTRLLRTMHGGS